MGIIIDCVSLIHSPTLWRILFFFLCPCTSHPLIDFIHKIPCGKSLSLELLCGDLFVFSLHKAANIQTLGPVPKCKNMFLSYMREPKDSQTVQIHARLVQLIHSSHTMYFCIIIALLQKINNYCCFLANLCPLKMQK